MEHLRLLGVSDDGSRLLLEGADGTSYELPLDERVHAALRGDRARLGQLQIELENQITPREIQARIRAGQTSEEIAHAAQVPVERVRRYETPVLMEREHIAELAQTTNVRRVTDAAAHPLREVVNERLQARGVDIDELEWDARRREDGRWAVRLEYSHGGRHRTAVWLFDHQRRTLEPHDDEASWLIGDERAVPEPPRAHRGRSRAHVPPVEDASLPRLAAVPDVPDEHDAPDEHDGPDEEAAPGTASNATDEPETAPGSGRDRSATEAESGPEQAAPDHPAPATTKPRPRRPGRRASVPSWDEILFGGATPPPED